MRPAAIAMMAVALTTGALGSSQPTFSVRSELVVLHVTVKAADGSFVSDLRPDAFSVIEDGRVQRVEFFETQDAPVNVGLIIDSSGSMAAGRNRVLAAVASFAEASNPNDEVFALTFNEYVQTALPPDAPFTNDPATLRDAVAASLAARGRTALYDGIATGLSYVARGRHRRQALVVLSDGGDNASTATFEGLLRRTQTSNTVVYTVAIADKTRRDTNPARLKAIADASGGEAFEPETVLDVPDALSRIAADLRRSYTVGYVSSNPGGDGRFRRVRVDVTLPDQRRAHVRTRTGYVVEELQ